MNHRDEVQCPACSELILPTAKKCKHCGEWVARTFEPTVIPDSAAHSSTEASQSAVTSAEGDGTRERISVIFAALVGIMVILGYTFVNNGGSFAAPVGRNSVTTMLREGVSGMQGELTDYTLISRSERGDCRKVHAYFRVDDSAELEGTFLYLWNESEGVAFRTYTAATGDRRGAAAPGWYSGEMNSDEQRVCSEMISRSSNNYSDGPYKVIR